MVQLRTLFIALALFASASLTASRASSSAPANYIPGELIVGMRESSSTAAHVAQLVGAEGQVEGEQRAIRPFRVRRKGRRSLQQMLERLRRMPGVAYVEPNQVIQAVGTPNDPQWGSQYGPKKMQVDDAWDIFDPQAQVVVAVLDTGIDYDHPDLAGRLLRNSAGQVIGYNSLTGTTNADDDGGHGTHCAGTIAAQINNATGVAGIAGWNPRIAGSDGYIKLMPVKVLDRAGNGSDTSVASGIIWAADRGAKVISLSLGAPAPSTTLGNAVTYAWNKGCVVVAAAGNNGVSTPFYPAAFPNVLSVGATDSNDTVATFSNWGSWVKVAAPGAFILSTYQGGGYQYMSGTSMACPHIAGLAALLRSQSPGLLNSQVNSFITKNVDPYVPYSGRAFGAGVGRANAYRALLASGGGAVLIPSAPTGLQATAGDRRVSLTWNPVAGATGYTVQRSTTSGSGFTAVASGLTAAGYTDSGVTNGSTYYYVVAASNSAGVSGASAQVSASPSATAAGGSTLRIDSGGSGYTSASGQVWTADKHFSGGSTYKYPLRDILGGTDDPLHLSIRMGANFSYTLPAAAGSYTLRLHFAECWFTSAGGRKFNVSVNGSPALSNFDIAAAAGGGNRLTVQEIPVTVTGSSVTVAFQKVLNDALVNAIELVPASGGGTPTAPAAPTGLQAAAGNGQVSLTWNTVVGATSYTVKRSTTSGASYQSVAGRG
ncbi:MAG: S8 family serine peptidase [Actinomycetota bacterium]